MDEETSKNINDLLAALLLLEDVGEARIFLRDLLTEKELIEIGKRWKAARLLSEQVPYSRIVEQTGLSTATVARISRWLSEGTGGYQLMLERIETRKKKHLHRS